MTALAALLLGALVLLPGGAAQTQDRAGEFDHYLLAVSWVPGLCATQTLRGDDPRCAPRAGLGWIVHGLWPQHAGGSWPEYCRSPHPNPSHAETARQMDLFGSTGAAWHQWNKHGRCTGLSAQEYFALTRHAVGRLALPEPGTLPHLPGPVTPAEIETAISALNPLSSPETMITSCRTGVFLEVRLCLTRDLAPRPCDQELRARACPARGMRVILRP
ncbi:MAG: ribonuclease T2 family protein [Pararhodobacter sp.]